MSKKLAWMPLYVRDYDESTDHLTCEQDGAYGRLLRKMWRRGDLPNEDEALARICGVTRTHWVRHIKPAVMPLMFITDIGTVSQKRLQKEREKAVKISEVRAESAKKNHENHTEESNDINGYTVALAHANGSAKREQMLVHPQYTEDGIKDHMLEAGSGKPPPALSVTPGETGQGSLLPTASVHLMPTVATRFDEFYQAYPRKVARPAAFKAYKRAVEDAPHVELMAGLKRFDWSGNPKYYPYPATWLNNRRWADGATSVPDEEVRTNDPQGIQSWCQSLPGIEPTVMDGDKACGNWMLGGWILDEVARLVAGAVELPTPCRMEWSLLRAWLDDGMEPEFIVRRIEENVSWLRRKGYYHAPSSLALFDAFVRGARKSA